MHVLFLAPKLCDLVLAVGHSVKSPDGLNLARPRTAEDEVVIESRVLE